MFLLRGNICPFFPKPWLISDLDTIRPFCLLITLTDHILWSLRDLASIKSCKQLCSAHLNAIDSRMARTRCLLVVEGFKPIKEAQALGSFRGACGTKTNITNPWDELWVKNHVDIYIQKTSMYRQQWKSNITNTHKHTCKPLKEGTKYTPSESSTLVAMVSVSFTSEKSSVRQRSYTTIIELQQQNNWVTKRSSAFYFFFSKLYSS